MPRMKRWHAARADIGWHTFALATGAGVGRWRCLNGQVQVQINITGATIAARSTTILAAPGVIPVDYRPTGTSVEGSGRSGVASIGTTAVTTTGGINAINLGDAATTWTGFVPYLPG